MPSTPSLFLAGQDITSAFLQSLQPQPWTSITPMNSWTNAAGAAAFQCRLFGSMELELIGVMNPGTISGGIQIGQIPNSAWYPNSTQNIQWSIFGTSALAPSTGMLEVTSAGAINAYNLNGSTPGIGFHGFVALDA